MHQVKADDATTANRSGVRRREKWADGLPSGVRASRRLSLQGLKKKMRKASGLKALSYRGGLGGVLELMV